MEDVASSLSVISRYIVSKLDVDEDAKFSSWIFNLFGDQDDSLVLTMLRALQLYKLVHNIAIPPTNVNCIKNKGESKLESAENIDILNVLNPHVIFVNFLDSVTFDPNLLLDLLMSNETCFLEYLVQYIRLILSDWDKFFASTSAINLDKMVDDEEGEEEGEEESESQTEDEVSREKQMDLNQHIRENEACEISTHAIKECKIETDEQRICGEEQQTKTNEVTNDSNKVHRDDSADSLSPTGRVKVGQEKVLSPNHQMLFTEQSIDDNVDDYSSELKKRKLTHPDCQNNSSLTFPEVLHHCSSEDLDEHPVKKNSTLDEIMTVLIRLRFSVEKMSTKGLFPYNVVPLLRLLEQLEDKYEQ